MVAAGALAATAVCTGAAVAATLPGGPMTVSVGALGQCQSRYAGGSNFYPAGGAVGDCGFFLGFPEAGNPAFLQKKVFGFQGIKGPGLASQYTAVDQGTVTGTGTAADPYQLITSFKVSDAAKAQEGDYALVKDTTRYANGEPQFSSTFDVENVTGQAGIPGLSTAPATALKFHAIYAGDLLTGNSDFATGVFVAGPPREIGGANEAMGVFGGFVEAPSPSPPWSSFQAGCWDVVPEIEGRCPTTSQADGGIWAAVRGATGEGPVFNGDIDPNPIDNAAGVSWDDHLSRALKPGEHALYTIVNRAQIPSGLTVQPATQTRTVGQTATVLVTATDNTGAPYANRPIVYSIGAANPKSGSVLTDSSGVATISYVGTAAGLDAAAVFLDLPGSGASAGQDPSSSAQIAWVPAAPSSRSANGGYRVQSVRVGSGGAITIVFVPVQNGTATLEVTVPTATISRKGSIAAKRKSCRRDQIRVRGKCAAKTTLSGKLSAKGRAGVARKLRVAPSSRVKRALRRGKKVQLTAKLTYKSALGGKPVTQTFHVTVKPPKKKKKH